MVKGLSTELARDNIHVNCVAQDGWIRHVGGCAERSATRDKVFRTIPMGRVGTPDEIAGPILFLCTPMPIYHCEIFNVNGGAVLVDKHLHAPNCCK